METRSRSRARAAGQVLRKRRRAGAGADQTEEENMETRSRARAAGQVLRKRRRAGAGAGQVLRKRRRAGAGKPHRSSDKIAPRPLKGLYFVVEDQIQKKCAIMEQPSNVAVPFGAPGMSFIAVNSKHGGDWIVGVGGRRTITYNASTLEVIQGPPIHSPKHQPVLISFGGMLYAITRRPRVVPGMDFEPWFEVISFEDGIPSINPYPTEKECFAYWVELPPPPFFPCKLTPFEFRNPPEVCVGSYAAVDGRIFLSLQQEEGTYVFHVVKKTWERVDGSNLPFIGQAAPLCHRMFAAFTKTKSNNDDAVTLFSLPINGTKWLPICEFLVGPTDHISRQFLCPLPSGRSFCWINAVHSATRNQFNLQARLTIFQLENLEGNDLSASVTLVLEEPGLIHTFPEGTPLTLIAALTMEADTSYPSILRAV